MANAQNGQWSVNVTCGSGSNSLNGVTSITVYGGTNATPANPPKAGGGGSVMKGDVGMTAGGIARWPAVWPTACGRCAAAGPTARMSADPSGRNPGPDGRAADPGPRLWGPGSPWPDPANLDSDGASGSVRTGTRPVAKVGVAAVVVLAGAKLLRQRRHRVVRTTVPDPGRVVRYLVGTCGRAAGAAGAVAGAGPGRHHHRR